MENYTFFGKREKKVFVFLGPSLSEDMKSFTCLLNAAVK